MNGASLWLEDKYANLLSSRLQRFTKRGPHTYNFRCPICGDSKKNKFLARGYIYQKRGSMFYRCHNCGAGMVLANFIKEIDSTLYKEYRLERLKESNGATERPASRPEQGKKSSPEPERVDRLEGLKPATYFPEDHPVSDYLRRRQLPAGAVADMWYADRFMEWVNTQVPGKFNESQLRRDEPRLVIPFRDSEGNIFAVTGRSFKSNSVKYMTIKFDEDQDKIFGMDRIDPSRRVYIVEGPIDSYFLDNCIAFAGSSGSLPDLGDHVVILDNEPRNREIMKLMEKLIETGHPVCIWPDGTREKDVNEMVMAGQTPEQVRRVIDDNTYSGLKAKIRFGAYRRS